MRFMLICQKANRKYGFCVGPLAINRAENKREFTDLMQRVKEFKEKWLISPMGEN